MLFLLVQKRSSAANFKVYLLLQLLIADANVVTFKRNCDTSATNSSFVITIVTFYFHSVAVFISFIISSSAFVIRLLRLEEVTNELQSLRET